MGTCFDPSVLIGTVFLILFGAPCTTGDPQPVYPNVMRHSEYDYIIVGAGSTGSVIANRLSEDPENKVLLIEAGGPPSGLSDIPFYTWKSYHTEMDWAYYTEPQEQACHGTDGRRNYLPRGKTLGGSSLLNAMLYLRGLPRDYDEWAKGGATGWSWDHVLHYFKKSEDNRDQSLADNGFHNTNGYLTVSTLNYGTELQKSLLEAVKYMGYKIGDINGPDPLVFTAPQFTSRDGLRCSTEKAFLRPAVTRDNLDILIHAHVTQVLIDENKRAYGVQFDQDKTSQIVRTRKEVILSAGVIGSPQILMLSGIGPKEHLEELQIPVIADLPVGQNFQDHITHGAQLYLLNSSVALVQSRIWNQENVGELLLGKGPLTVPCGVELVGYVNTKFQDPSEEWPDIEIAIASSVALPPVNKKIHENLQQFKDRDIITVLPWVCRPKGRGYVKLRSRNPYDHPIIDPKYFSEEDDLDRLVEGIKIAERIMQTPSMQKYGPVRIPEEVPGCGNIDTKSEEYLRCMAKSLTITIYQHSGTCRMGDPKDPSTVVDPELRVKGITGLRVADASIMPLGTSGTLNAPCIMIGEKAADLIKGLFWDPKHNKVVPLNCLRKENTEL